VRPATERDGPAVTALAAVAGGLGWWGIEQRNGPDRPDLARFVETDGDEIVAYGCVWQRKASGVFGLDTLVHPGHRGRGLGRKLIDRLFEELGARGATAVEARVDVDHADALQFILRRGFFELDRLERVRLDLDRPEDLESAPEGVAITSLAEAGPAVVPALHTLGNTAFSERPIRYLEPFIESPLAQFERTLAAALPDGSFVATIGGEVIGFTGLMTGREPGTLLAFMTAVHPDVRGRGIARALKQRAIAWARRNGYRAIFSNSPNPDMQALNERLGFARYAPTEIRMGRRLMPGPR